jgi:hypothetical protein
VPSRPAVTLRRLALLLAVLAGGTGCYSWRPVTSGPEVVIRDARPRDVRTTLSDGTVLTLQNPMLASDTIVGSSRAGTVRAPTALVERLEVQRFSFVRTTALITLHAGVVVGLIAAIIAVQPHYRGF